jgi:hypothetical protein
MAQSRRDQRQGELDRPRLTKGAVQRGARALGHVRSLYSVRRERRRSSGHRACSRAAHVFDQRTPIPTKLQQSRASRDRSPFGNGPSCAAVRKNTTVQEWSLWPKVSVTDRVSETEALPNSAIPALGLGSAGDGVVGGEGSAGQPLDSSGGHKQTEGKAASSSGLGSPMDSTGVQESDRRTP